MPSGERKCPACGDKFVPIQKGNKFFWPEHTSAVHDPSGNMDPNYPCKNSGKRIN